MNKNNTQINCPACGTAIDVQDILKHQLEDEIKKKYEDKQAQAEKDLAIEQEKLAKEKKDLVKQVEEQLKEKTKNLEIELKSKLQEEQTDRIASLEKELNEKSKKINELNRSKAEIEKLKREKNELKEEIEAEAQKKINEQVTAAREKIKKSEEDKNELRIKELQKQLEDQKKLTEEMKRKQEQGSMQMQGEVQELAIEEWLIDKFPLDTIDEIKKGVKGGDCLQIVNTPNKQNCGKIYYESKRAKSFQRSWIEKFKTDMRDQEADVGVIVTEVMPKDFERMGLLDRVWVCSYEEFKSLCGILRESVIQVSMVVSSQENKGDKMNMLYEFLTGNGFRMQVEASVEGFVSMKNALESEKRSMQRIWKEREKQIEKVIKNTSEMHGSIKGIAGSAIQSVKALELSGGDVDSEN